MRGRGDAVSGMLLRGEKDTYHTIFNCRIYFLFYSACGGRLYIEILSQLSNIVSCYLHRIIYLLILIVSRVSVINNRLRVLSFLCVKLRQTLVGAVWRI